jgi:hypothetical protein
MCWRRCPIVLDLNGDGVQTLALGATTGTFDLMNTGTAVRSGWISADDGFLAMDTNGNGVIDDRSELFGGAVGEGVAKLAQLDTNRDGVVDARDPSFSLETRRNREQDLAKAHRSAHPVPAARIPMGTSSSPDIHYP